MVTQSTRKGVTISCKYCGSTTVVKAGSYRGIQRYWCKSCARRFKLDDHLFHMQVPADCVGSALEMYYEGRSINDIRNQLEREYHYYPSRSLIPRWVNNFTDRAITFFKHYYPRVGDTWIVSESSPPLLNKPFWIYDVVDEKTYFLLASCITSARNEEALKTLMQKALETAGSTPKVIVAYMPYSYFVMVRRVFSKYIIKEPPASNDNVEIVDNVCNLFTVRTSIVRNLKTLETTRKVVDGWHVHYNYLKPQESRGYKTPAEEAQIDYSIKNWVDLARAYVSI